MCAGGATFLQMLLEDAELTRRRGRWLSARTMEIYLQESSATLFFPQQPAATKERIMQAAQTFTNMLQKVKLFRQNHIPTAAWYLLVSAETDAKQMGKNGSLGGDMDGKMDDNIHTNPVQGATGRCHCKVPLQGAAWCRCRVSLQGSAWGAAAGCCLSFAPAGFFWGSKGHGIWHWHGLQGLDISHLLKCTASLLFGFLLADKFGVIVNKLCRATVVTLPALWSGRRWRVLLESAGWRCCGAAAGCRCSALLLRDARGVVAAGCRVPLQGAAWGCCCSPGARVSSWLAGDAAAAAGCCLSVLLWEWWSWLAGVVAGRCFQGAAVWVTCVLWRWPAGTAARCCFRVLLLECCLRFWSGLLLPLQGVVEGTVRLPRALWSWLAGAGAGCCLGCCWVACALWLSLAGAAAVL